MLEIKSSCNKLSFCKKTPCPQYDNNSWEIYRLMLLFPTLLSPMEIFCNKIPTMKFHHSYDMFI